MHSLDHAFAVESREELLGIVTNSDVRKVSAALWSKLRVRDVMTPLSQLTTLPPDAPAERVFEALALCDVRQIPVVEKGRLHGFVRRRDLSCWLSRRARTSPC